jgi:hypothetical protein
MSSSRAKGLMIDDKEMGYEKLTAITWLWRSSNGGPCEHKNKPSRSRQDRDRLNPLAPELFF